ncbi:MAG TPA: phosphoribosylformylglycinamidine cyclo-ligase [Dehalococcoidia bacterium]|nr:phosphoribosylformylglycinamidine cyclo-ligase [Dehalococcoidia bacterium]
MTTPHNANEPLTYASSGVDLNARRSVVERYRDAARHAGRPEVLSGIDPFAGLFALGAGKYKDPVLVSSTDGVGTKTKLAGLVGRYESLGQDIVANCVNDALTTGAEPLFFLDYIGSSDLPADAKVAIVKGIADACAEIGCALLGGETADMPGVYPPGEFDLVGFVVGAVERDRLIDGTRIAAGDLLFALPSNGLHTNGYSLARAALGIGMHEDGAASDRDRLLRYEPDLGATLAGALLAPHICYVNALKPALKLSDSDGRPLIKGLAHITGGGLEENVPRILPAGLGARFQRNSWPVPPIFGRVQQAGAIDDAEMDRVFNMGLGMIIAVGPEDARALTSALPEAIEVGLVSIATGVAFT